MVEGQPNTRLEEGEVELFANPLVDAAARKGDVELIVLPQSQYSSTGYDVNEIVKLPVHQPVCGEGFAEGIIER